MCYFWALSAWGQNAPLCSWLWPFHLSVSCPLLLVWKAVLVSDFVCFVLCTYGISARAFRNTGLLKGCGILTGAWHWALCCHALSETCVCTSFCFWPVWPDIWGYAMSIAETLVRGWQTHHGQIVLPSEFYESTCTPDAVDAVMMPAELVRLHWFCGVLHLAEQCSGSTEQNCWQQHFAWNLLSCWWGSGQTTPSSLLGPQVDLQQP